MRVNIPLLPCTLTHQNAYVSVDASLRVYTHQRVFLRMCIFTVVCACLRLRVCFGCLPTSLRRMCTLQHIYFRSACVAACTFKSVPFCLGSCTSKPGMLGRQQQMQKNMAHAVLCTVSVEAYMLHVEACMAGTDARVCE
jgi:hypothetical protein